MIGRHSLLSGFFLVCSRFVPFSNRTISPIFGSGNSWILEGGIQPKDRVLPSLEQDRPLLDMLHIYIVSFQLRGEDSVTGRGFS